MGDSPSISEQVGSWSRGIGIDAISAEMVTSEIRREVQKIVTYFRKDPHLNNLSDRELEEAAQEALKWAPSVGARPSPLTGRKVELGVYIEKYRLYLKNEGIDPEARPPSFASMASQFGYFSLAHGTTVSGFLSLLREKMLQSAAASGKPQKYPGTSNPNFTYLEALPKSIEIVLFKRYPVTGRSAGYKTEDMPVYLEFDMAILDEVAWSHMNIHWMNGNKNRTFSIEPTHSLAAFFNMIKEVPTRPPVGHERDMNFGPPGMYKAGYKSISDFELANEFLFSGPIDFWKYIKGIYVDPDMKDGLIELLKGEEFGEKVISLLK